MLWKKVKTYSRKNPSDLEKLHPGSSPNEVGKEEGPGYVDVLCQIVGTTARTSENCFSIKKRI